LSASSSAFLALRDDRLYQQSPLRGENSFVGSLFRRSTSNECYFGDARTDIDRNDVAKTAEKRPQRRIVPKLVGHKSLVSARLGRAQQAHRESHADPSALPDIGDYESHLGAGVVANRHIAKADGVAAVRLVEFGDESEPPEVIDISQRAKKGLHQDIGRRVKP